MTLQTNVMMASSMPCDQWLSVDLYREDLATALRLHGGSFVPQIVIPNTGAELPWYQKYKARYLEYPNLLKRTYKQRINKTLLHVLDQSYGHLCKISMPTIVTCHDLSEYSYNADNPISLVLWKYRVNSMVNAQYVVCSSENTANDVGRLIGVERDRIVVIPLAVSPNYRLINSIQATRSALLGSPIQPVDTFVLLHVGTNIYRKNIPTLLEALSILDGRGYNVVLVKVGPSFWEDGYGELIDRLKVSNLIHEVGLVSEDDLVKIYNSSDALLFPSIFEGFGRPVVEAQACGLPCVIASTSSLPEVGGPHSLYHAAADAPGLAAQVIKLIEAPGLRKVIIDSGLEYVKKFTMESYARQMTNVYKRAMSEFNG
tara:strand:+ start:364 stop:1479 length:1116 start_codon:yes stop_codon:yes gene_type:complete